jgi:uncharacterized membrane protein
VVQRLGYLDWMRGLAALIMLQGHAFDAWLRPEDRAGEWFWWSQFLGGLPAPIFLFLVGVSLSLVIDKLRARQTPVFKIGKTILRRSAWVLFLAYAFRLQQFLSWYPASRWSDVFKVDTLNCIAVCIGVVGFASLLFQSRRANAVFMGIATASIVFLTPWIYPLRTAAPPLLQSYFNGGGHPEYFSVIPWIGFSLAGVTFGWLLLHARMRQAEHRFFIGVAGVGVLAYALGALLSRSPIFMYGFFDYSLTSPYFFMMRLGLLLLVFCGAYRWSLRSTAHRWSPLRTLGQASLLVYWVHIELVYGRGFHDWGRALEVSDVALQLVWFVPMMLLLATAARQWRPALEYARGFVTNTSETLQVLTAKR